MMMINVSQIENLSRKELQALAKERGIKANSKSKILIEKLQNWFEKENKENVVASGEAPVKKQKKSTFKFNDSELHLLSRKELQKMCKENSIRANQNTEDLVKSLREVVTKKNADKSTIKKEKKKRTMITSPEKKKTLSPEKKTTTKKIMKELDEEEKDTIEMMEVYVKETSSPKQKTLNDVFDTSPIIQYGTKKRKSLRTKQLANFNDIFDDAMKENKSIMKNDEKTKKSRHIYVKSLKARPFKPKKSKRTITAPKAFNLSQSNYGSHKKRIHDGDKVKPTWNMKTKPLPAFRGDSLFSPKKRRRTKNSFNLKESLAKPLTWVPKKGKLPSFRL